MTRAEMIATLHKIERAQQDRVEVWRIVIDAHGRETGQRIYWGSFQRPPGSQNRDPHSQGE